MAGITHESRRAIIGAVTEDPNEGTFVDSFTAANSAVRLLEPPTWNGDPRFFEQQAVGSSYSRPKPTYGGTLGQLSFVFALNGAGVATPESTVPKYVNVWTPCGVQIEVAEEHTGSAAPSGSGFIPGERIEQTGAIYATYIETVGNNVITGEVNGTDTAAQWTGVTSEETWTSTAPGSPYGQLIRYDSAPEAHSFFVGFPYDDLSTMSRYSFRGCRGDFNIVANGIGEPVRVECTVNGVFNAFSDETTIAPTYDDPLPLGFIDANFSAPGPWAAADICLNTMNIASNIATTPRDCANDPEGYKSVRKTDRNPQAGFTAEQVEFSVFDNFKALKDQTAGSLYSSIGSTNGAGDRVKIVAGQATYRGMSSEDDNGIAKVQYPLQLNKVGNQEDTELLILLW